MCSLKFTSSSIGLQPRYHYCREPVVPRHFMGRSLTPFNIASKGKYQDGVGFEPENEGKKNEINIFKNEQCPYLLIVMRLVNINGRESLASEHPTKNTQKKQQKDKRKQDATAR